MNSTTTKQDICRRCKGKGRGDWAVVFMGIPGGCFRCQATGRESVARRIAARAAIEAQIASETEDASFTVEADSAREARHAFGTGFGVSPMATTEVEPGLWAMTYPMHPDWMPPVAGWLWEDVA
jgi:hypothetical protein